MRIFSKAKDGGPRSPVDAYFIIELKNFFSIALLKFNEGSRENYHTHAFDALTWFISGELVEEEVSGDTYVYTRSIWPKCTPKDKCHRVRSLTTSWCFTIRGPWSDTWEEYNERTDTTTVYTHGRHVVEVR